MEFSAATVITVWVVIVLIALALTVFLVSIYVLTPVPRTLLPIEFEYTDPISRAKRLHPLALCPITAVDSDSASQTVTTSLVVPAFNEKDRIKDMLDEALSYFRARKRKELNYSFEIIVVDDGSTDSTTEVVNEWARSNECQECRVLTFSKNRGKGGAVTQVNSIGASSPSLVHYITTVTQVH